MIAVSSLEPASGREAFHGPDLTCPSNEDLSAEPRQSGAKLTASADAPERPLVAGNRRRQTAQHGSSPHGPQSAFAIRQRNDEPLLNKRQLLQNNYKVTTVALSAHCRFANRPKVTERGN